jgi:parallel beta-helix repeat protein
MLRLSAVAGLVVLVMASAYALRLPGLSDQARPTVPPTAPGASEGRASATPLTSPTAAPTPGATDDGTGPLPAATSSPGPDLALRVETNGDDTTGDGSRLRPWRTLAHALEAVPDRAVIRLGPGTFDGAFIGRPGVTVVGTSGASEVVGGLTIQADDVTISGLTLTGVSEPYTGALVVREARGAVIVGNVVRGNPFGIQLVDALGVRIERNTVTDNGYGLEIHGRTDGSIVIANDIVDNDRRLDASRGAGGINLFFTSGGITFENNVISRNDDVGIEIYGASDLDIRGNRLSGSNDLIETGTQDDRPCDNVSITRNLFYSERVGDLDEERGIYLRCATDAVVSWNTFDGLDRFAIGLFQGSGGFNGPLRRVEISHNIFADGRAFSIDSPMPPDVTIDHDVLFPCQSDPCPALGDEFAFVQGHAGTDRFSVFRSWTGYETNGMFADPLFVDPLAHDYHLRAGSPASGIAGRFEAPPG